MKTICTNVVGLVLLLAGLSAAGQDTTQAIRPQPDSIRVGTSTLVDSNVVAADTAQVSVRAQREIRRIVPRKATIRSLLLPGLGQAYNRHYWKMPIIYVGVAGFGYSIWFLNRRFLAFEDAYRVAYNVPSRDPRDKVALFEGREVPAQQLRQGVIYYRRWRDFNVIFLVALWGLQAVEANVAAHMKTFDLSDDLSLNVRPSLQLLPGGLAPGVGLTFTVKK